MAFVNRRQELAILETFCESVRRDHPERHLALTGVRRIGKSRLIGHFADTHHEQLVVPLQVDRISATPGGLLLAMVTGCVNAVLWTERSSLLPRAAQPSEIRATAYNISHEFGELVQGTMALLDQRRVNAQQVFDAAVGLPEDIARVLQQPVLVFADEFQRFAALSMSAPFSPGRHGGPAALEHLLGAFRASIEQRPHVGWVITGSSVQMIRELLDRGPLLGRFDEHILEAFDTDTTDELTRSIWQQESHVEWTEHAITRVFRLSQGHPFYADVISRGAAQAAKNLEQPVSGSMVDGAFVDAAQQPQGAIAVACREMSDSLESRTPHLLGILLALARDDNGTVSAIAAEVGTPSSNTHRNLQDLIRLGLVRRVGDEYQTVDPVFRYWLATSSDPFAPAPVLLDPPAARRAVRVFEEAFLREREQRGPLREGYVRELVRTFAGQRTQGQRFGHPGGHVILPQVSSVDKIIAVDTEGSVRGRASEIELDVHFGDDVDWLCEVKDRGDSAGEATLVLASRKALFLRAHFALPAGPLWVVSVNGFTDEARAYARREHVYISTLSDLEGLRNDIGSHL